MAEPKTSSRKKLQPVYWLSRASRCYNCDGKLEPGVIVRLVEGNEEREVLCKECAGLKNLDFLPSGNARVTQLVQKYSTQTFVVMQWSDLWKCYERKGLLVEADALAKARLESGGNAETT